MKEHTEIKNTSRAGNIAKSSVVLGLFLFWSFSFSRVHMVHAEDKMTIFVSTGCPHCLKVTEFIAEYGIEDKFVVLNVHTDDGAAEKYTDFVTEHELPLQEQGTPTLVYDDESWVVGDTPIIDFLAERYELHENGNTGNTNGNTDDGTGSSTDNGGIIGNNSTDINFTFWDYMVFGIGLIVVSSVVGYGIVNLANGRSKS